MKTAFIVTSAGAYKTCVVTDDMGRPVGYTVEDGERLVSDIPAPAIQPVDGPRTGLLKPVLSDGNWIEGATAEELAAWDAEHPAVEPVHEPDVWDEMAEAYRKGVQNA